MINKMDNSNKNGHKDLIVWQKSMNLVEEVYKLVKEMPKDEKFNLSSQISRAAVSVPSNIAEGYRRNSDKSFKQFLLIAFGSSAELETQIELVKRLEILKNFDFSKIDSLLFDTIRLLNAFIRKLK